MSFLARRLLAVTPDAGGGASTLPAAFFDGGEEGFFYCSSSSNIWSDDARQIPASLDTFDIACIDDQSGNDHHYFPLAEDTFKLVSYGTAGQRAVIGDQSSAKILSPKIARTAGGTFTVAMSFKAMNANNTLSTNKDLIKFQFGSSTRFVALRTYDTSGESVMRYYYNAGSGYTLVINAWEWTNNTNEDEAFLVILEIGENGATHWRAGEGDTSLNQGGIITNDFSALQSDFMNKVQFVGNTTTHAEHSMLSMALYIERTLTADERADLLTHFNDYHRDY